MASEMYEIEYRATTIYQANDLLRQATDEALTANQEGRLGYMYTGPGEYVFALRDLLAQRGVECSITARPS